MKIQATDYKKLSVNHLSDKGLISRIYKEFSKLNSKEGNYLNREYFTKKVIQTAKSPIKHMKRYSIALTIRKLPVKTTVRSG